MSKLLEQAFRIAQDLPPERQDDVARQILSLVSRDSAAPDSIHPDHLSGVTEGLEQARRGEFASDEAVAAAFRRFG